MMRTRLAPWHLVKAGAVLTLVALVLVACGSDDPPAAATVATTTALPASVPTEGAQSGAVAASPTAVAPTPTPTAAAVQTTVPEPSSTPEPRPLPSPAAETTPILAPAPEATVDVAQSQRASRLAEEAIGFLREFTRDYSPRASGTDQELRAAEFLASEFEALGYRTEIQPFTVDVESAAVRVGTERAEFPALPMTLSGMGDVSGKLVDVGKARDGDLPEERIDGRIAVIQRGEVPFGEKVSRVADAGAVGAIVYNNTAGLFRGTLGEQGQIPVVALSHENGEAIVSMMDGGDVEASVSVLVETRDTRNVVAEKQGAGVEPKVVVLGGHYDTVPDVPGANDNGAGIATLMTIARELEGSSHPYTLRFIAFGSEELGLRGSQFYLSPLGLEEKLNIEMMLNFDALGTGRVVGILGNDELVTSILDVGEKAGIESERRPSLNRGASSDHASFRAAGIPAAFLLADDFSRIHTPEDRVEFVRPELLGNSAALALLFLESLAAE
jgi:aminopeptidase YwaD